MIHAGQWRRTLTECVSIKLCHVYMEGKPAWESSSSSGQHFGDDLPGQALRHGKEGNEKEGLNQCNKCTTLNNKLDQVV